MTRGTIPPPQRQLTRVILRQPRPVNYPPRLSLCLLSHRGGFGFGQLVTVQTLVKLGAPLDALDHGRATPLHSAAGKGHVKVLRVLREMGGNLFARADCGRTALHTAAAYGQRDAVRASPPILSCTGAGMPLQHEGETRNRQARAFHARPLGRC